MLRSKIIPVTMAAVVTLASAGTVLAESETGEHQEIKTVLSAKTSLTEAITAAERETGGRAVDAGIENEDGALAYEVKVVKGDTFQKVLVAPDTGKVTEVMSAKADSDEHGDRDKD